MQEYKNHPAVAHFAGMKLDEEDGEVSPDAVQLLCSDSIRSSQTPVPCCYVPQSVTLLHLKTQPEIVSQCHYTKAAEL